MFSLKPYCLHKQFRHIVSYYCQGMMGTLQKSKFTDASQELTLREAGLSEANSLRFTFNSFMHSILHYGLALKKAFKQCFSKFGLVIGFPFFIQHRTLSTVRGSSQRDIGTTGINGHSYIIL